MSDKTSLKPIDMKISEKKNRLKIKKQKDELTANKNIFLHFSRFIRFELSGIIGTISFTH